MPFPAFTSRGPYAPHERRRPALGQGTTLQAVLDACASGRLAARVCGVISNNRDAALRRARAAGVPAMHLSAVTAGGAEAADQALRDALVALGAQWVLLAGYMKPLLGPRTLAAFDGRIINTHPALLPEFGGQGLYGMNVHRAVRPPAGRSQAPRCTGSMPATTPGR